MFFPIFPWLFNILDCCQVKTVILWLWPTFRPSKSCPDFTLCYPSASCQPLPMRIFQNITLARRIFSLLGPQSQDRAHCLTVGWLKQNKERSARRGPSKFPLHSSVGFNQSTYCRFTGIDLSMKKSFYVIPLSSLSLFDWNPAPLLFFKRFPAWPSIQHQALHIYIHSTSFLHLTWSKAVTAPHYRCRPITSLSSYESDHWFALCGLKK